MGFGLRRDKKDTRREKVSENVEKWEFCESVVTKRLVFIHCDIIFHVSRRLTSAETNAASFMFDECYSRRCVHHVLVSQSLVKGPKSVNREKTRSSKAREFFFPRNRSIPKSRDESANAMETHAFAFSRVPSSLENKFADSLSRKMSVSIKHLRQRRRTSNYYKPQRVKEQRSNLRSFFCRLCHKVDNLQSENQLKGKLRENSKNFAKSEANKMSEHCEN